MRSNESPLHGPREVEYVRVLGVRSFGVQAVIITDPGALAPNAIDGRMTRATKRPTSPYIRWQRLCGATRVFASYAQNPR